MASRQNLNNRSNAFKAIGGSGVLSKVYGAAQKQLKKRRDQPTISEQPGDLAGERPIQSGGGGLFGAMAEKLGRSGTLQRVDQSRLQPDFRKAMQQAQDRQQRLTPPPAPTQPPIQTGPGYEQRDEPVFDQSAIATEEQIPGQSTPLPPPSTASNVTNRLARNRVTARQPTEDIPPDSPRSRGMRRRR